MKFADLPPDIKALFGEYLEETQRRYRHGALFGSVEVHTMLTKLRQTIQKELK